MKVLKFGGSSVKSASRIKNVVEIIVNAYQEDAAIAVVVSAFGGVTNQLAQAGDLASKGEKSYIDILTELRSRHFVAAEELLSGEDLNEVEDFFEQRLHELQELLHGVYLVRELTLRTNDLILSFGERFSAFLLAAAIRGRGIDCEYADARRFIITDDSFGAARVDFAKTNQLVGDYFWGGKSLKVVTGFIAATESGLTVTLGRDGSDYSAAIIGAALRAEMIEIWTDVDGVMTCDPRKVKTAFPVAQMTYEEAMELSHFGAEVIHPPTIQPALRGGIPIRIRNSMNPTFPGTTISAKREPSEYVVKGITSIDEISLLRLQGSGLIDNNTKFYERLFRALSQGKINIVMISQASSERSICFAVKPDAVELARKLLDEEFRMEIQIGVLDRIFVEEGFSIVAIVGSNMKNTVGVSAKLFNALAGAEVSAAAIAQGSSELNITVVVHKTDAMKALNAIHETFFYKD